MSKLNEIKGITKHYQSFLRNMLLSSCYRFFFCLDLWTLCSHFLALCLHTDHSLSA